MIDRFFRTALIACVLVWTGCATFPSTGPAQITEADTRLKVMTFNIRYGTADDGENAWSLRKHTVIEMIRRHDPDLLGVQEALAFQVDYLAEQLKGWSWVGVGRDDGMKEGEFSAVFYRTARFDCPQHGTWWLSETPEIPGSKSWDAALTRIATWTRLRERSTGRDLVFVNTHFDHRGPQARRNSASLLREKTLALAGAHPCVVVGDFNARPGGEVHRNLLGTNKSQDGATAPYFVDANESLGQGVTPGSGHGFRGGPGRARIDWIVHSEPLKALTASIDQGKIDGRWPSDHYPVIAELRWP